MNAIDMYEQAREQSARYDGEYFAVVEIVNYRTGRSRYAIMSGTRKIVSKSRGPEFVGVVAQYRNGQAIDTPKKPTVHPGANYNVNGLPF